MFFSVIPCILSILIFIIQYAVLLVSGFNYIDLKLILRALLNFFCSIFFMFFLILFFCPIEPLDTDIPFIWEDEYRIKKLKYMKKGLNEKRSRNRSE